MEQPTVVIVEGDLLFAQALTCFLEDLGYQVLATTDTEQGAVQVVRERRPDVVLMDVKLVGSSGLDAASMIRQSSEVPIVSARLTPMTGQFNPLSSRSATLP